MDNKHKVLNSQQLGNVGYKTKYQAFHEQSTR